LVFLTNSLKFLFVGEEHQRKTGKILVPRWLLVFLTNSLKFLFIGEEHQRKTGRSKAKALHSNQFF